MYLPTQFEETRLDILHALMRAHPLAVLVTVGENGIAANHIPLELDSAPAPLGVLRGHVARANAVWRDRLQLEESLAIFQGPQVYISPSLYPMKQRTGEVVPTWDYAVVHVRGTLRFVHDAAWMRALVARLTDANESKRAAPWKIDDAPPEYIAGMLQAIVGFELTITSLRGKWKVSQNRDRADQRGVIEGLRATAEPQSCEIADMLQARGALKLVE